MMNNYKLEIPDQVIERVDALAGHFGGIDGVRSIALSIALERGLRMLEEDSTREELPKPPREQTIDRVSPKKGRSMRSKDELTKETLQYLLDVNGIIVTNAMVQKMTGTSCDSKLRALREEGLVRSTVLTGNKGRKALGWTITHSGKKWLKEHE